MPRRKQRKSSLDNADLRFSLSFYFMDMFNGIHPPERKKIGLVKSAGQFIPYNGEAPEIFSQPLVISDDSNAYISGVESSNVSALVPYGGAWYKIKRCRPVEGKTFNNGPWGGIPRKNCRNELYSFEKISAEYSKYDDIAPPLIPIGMFEHEMKFNNDNVCSGIMECSGDTRISEVEGSLLGLSRRHPHLWNCEYLDKLFSGVARWAGFSQRIMQEANVAPKEASFDLDNYVVYPVNEKGFGVGRVDLGGALHESNAEKTLKVKKEFDEREFAFTPSIFVDAQIAIDFKIPFRGMRKARHNGKRINLKYCDENEHKEEDEKVITLHIRKDRFAWVDSIKKEYLKYSEGTDVPEPIEKEIINPLFC